MPREERFFNFFSQSADLILTSAQEFRLMLSDLSKAEEKAHRIKELEHQCDNITHQTVEALHKTFITPLDREDIHNLICKLDDVLDFIDAAATRLHLYELKTVPQEAFELADVCIQSAQSIKEAVNLLSDLKNPQLIKKHCIEVNRLENKADQILRASIAKLFKSEPDLRLVIQLKEILEILETVTDRCEDVANIIDGIVLEYS